jgi:hypothetical protein
MKREVKEQVIALLAGELDDATDNLDDLECQAVAMMRELAQGVVQRKLDDKKGATEDPGSAVRVDGRPASSGIDTRRS